MAGTETAKALISIEPVALSAGGVGELFLLPVSKFPLPEDELDGVRNFLSRLTEEIRKAASWNYEVLIQMAQLHLADGPSRLSKNAREWFPQMGLGVWPDRKPPTLYTIEELQNLKRGERPRISMYQTFRVSTSAEARNAARNTMLGLGTILQIVLWDSWEKFLTRTSEILLSPIQEESFRYFPFYVPLLEQRSFVNAKAEDLDRWLCGISIYIRESAEDKGILIFSTEPLRPFLEKAGAVLETEPKFRWKFSG